MSPPSGHRRQLNLFGEPDPPPSETVAPAAVPEALHRIAARLPDHVRLGTSSWSFAGWRGIVYDAAAAQKRLARDGLGAYARHPLLRAVGIDRTYYAPITADEFEAYARVVPAGFRFLVKAFGACTSPFIAKNGRPTEEANQHYLDPDFATREVIGPMTGGLGDRAGPLVFQFPPQGSAVTREPERFSERLAHFLAALPKGPLYAVELRDKALLTASYVDALAAAGARHCSTLHPRMPPVAVQQECTTALPAGPLIVRWMLRAGLTYERARQRYEPFSKLVDEDPDNRASVAALCARHAAAGSDVMVVANNKAEGSAPLTLFKLAQAIADALPTSPTGLTPRGNKPASPR